MRTIPLLGNLGRELYQNDIGVWLIRDADRSPVRDLNTYEARLVNSAIAACASQEAKGCAQVRRDLVAARETTARTMTAWREALGAEQHHDLAAVTGQLRLQNTARHVVIGAHRERCKSLDDLVAVQTSQGNWDSDPYMQGMANGMILAQSLMAGNDSPAFLEAPLVWGRDRDTLRGRYRLSRARRSSILEAACEALGGWILNEPAVS